VLFRSRPNSKRTDWPYARLTLVRFNLEWLTSNRAASTPATPAR
jgi:hypothetical protein